MRLLVLAKMTTALFGEQPDQKPALNPRLTVRPAKGQDLVLRPSASNPAVQRWQRLHPLDEHGQEQTVRILLQQARSRGSVPLTDKQARSKAIRGLLRAGVVAVEPLPRDALYQHTMKLTPKGMGMLVAREQREKAQAAARQAGLFKAFRLLVKATQAALFGAPTPPPGPPPGTQQVQVRAHARRTRTGVSAVQAHTATRPKAQAELVLEPRFSLPPDPALEAETDAFIAESRRYHDTAIDDAIDRARRRMENAGVHKSLMGASLALLQAELIHDFHAYLASHTFHDGASDVYYRRPGAPGMALFLTISGIITMIQDAAGTSRSSAALDDRYFESRAEIIKAEQFAIERVRSALDEGVPGVIAEAERVTAAGFKVPVAPFYEPGLAPTEVGMRAQRDLVMVYAKALTKKIAAETDYDPSPDIEHVRRWLDLYAASLASAADVAAAEADLFGVQQKLDPTDTRTPHVLAMDLGTEDGLEFEEIKESRRSLVEVTRMRGLRGGHWGKVEYDGGSASHYASALAVVADHGRLRLPGGGMRAMTVRPQSEHDLWTAKGEWLYAQRRIREVDRKKAPTVFRGMMIAAASAEDLREGRVTEFPLTGCTAWTMKRDIALHYADSFWTARNTQAGAPVPVVFALERDDDVDRQVAMWHEDTELDSGLAYELLTTTPAVRVLSAKMTNLGERQYDDYGLSYEKKHEVLLVTCRGIPDIEAPPSAKKVIGASLDS